MDDPDRKEAPAPEAPGPQGVNVIPLTQTTPGDLPVVAVCPYCAADLSTVTVGRYVEELGGKGIQAFHPLRCPECWHPLLFAAGPYKVVVPRA